jgi:DNA invertase Pin-like site-specific DNA recombinase
MKGQKIGYIRVSASDQNPDRQLEGILLDRKFIDKFTGKVLDRPALNEMVQYIREGDRIYVHSMDRLARNLLDLKNVVKQITEKKAEIQFLKENLIFTGDDSPMSILLLSMMGAFAEFEVSLIRERQREGIRLARERGVYIGRRKVFNEQQIEEIRRLDEEGYRKKEICERFNVSRGCIYKYLKKPGKDSYG